MKSAMTEREWRLRHKLDEVRDERDDALQLIRDLTGKKVDGLCRCLYCGRPSLRSRVCPLHRDLPQLEAGPF